MYGSRPHISCNLTESPPPPTYTQMYKTEAYLLSLDYLFAKSDDLPEISVILLFMVSTPMA